MKRLYLGCIIYCWQALLWAAASPIPMLQESSSQMMQVLEQHKSELPKHPEIIRAAVLRYLLPHVDLQGMSRSVLGRDAWQKASVSEKQAFTQAFTDLVIRTYSAPLTQYNHEVIRFLPVRGAIPDNFIQIDSVVVQTSGHQIPVTYQLVYLQGQWKIYDLSVEGISLLQSFRSQFAEALQHQSITQLISNMKKKQA
ncbi:MAG: ABC transporter substrate-binding protein [Legionellaceae bacterium]|nr:ABC transporter substrate-binding protein [Legionellaceae bacterium]